MKWFKHSSNASRELPVRRIRDDYGYYGVGIFWTIMERVVHNDGLIRLEELEHEFNSRHFPKAKTRKIILNYGFFTVDASNYVSIAGKKSELVHTDSVPTARTNKINALEEDKKRIEKKKTSEKKSTSCSMAALLSQAASEAEKEFYQRMQQEYPNICTMSSPLTYAEMQRLLRDYARPQVLEVLNDMENLPRLARRYLSANLTCRGWIRIRRDRNNS